MNTGIENYNKSRNKLKIDEIKQILPDIKLLEEIPRSCFSNYVIIWGFKDINLDVYFQLKAIK